ncbi:hypothetical protein F4823DRAFT_614631 [Ustulina deusta]|nr:hypothetical protein F4823DRAFT_614631 [Ustulina deusta]
MMVEGLKKAAGRIQNHIAQVPDRTVQIDEQGQKVIQERQPPTTMCQLIDMLPTAAIDDIWTHEEEERFLSMTCGASLGLGEGGHLYALGVQRYVFDRATEQLGPSSVTDDAHTQRDFPRVCCTNR